MKKITIFLTCVIFSVLLFSQKGLTCTTFYIENNDFKLVGYNQDMPWGDGLIFVNKRNVSKTTIQQAPNQVPAEWISRYGSITFSLIGREMPNAGMNEAGLTVISLTLSETIEPAIDSRPYVNLGPNWVQYQLDNCSTVSEVVETDSQIRPINKFKNINPNTKCHYFISDSEGNSAVIEFLNGAMVCHSTDESTLCEPMPARVITNNTYSNSIAYYNSYLATGVCGYPSDCSGESSGNRFVRAAERLDNYDGSEDAISYAFDTLYNVKQTSYLSTQWSIIFDIQNRLIHFRTIDKQQVRDIDLNAFDFSCETPVKILDINSDLSGDVSDDFIDYTQEINQDLVISCSIKMGIPQTLYDPIWQHPEEHTFCIPVGDLNADGCVDRTDYNIIIADIRGPAPHNMAYDLNHDGKVNIADARYLATLFTNPKGAACN